MPIDYEPYAIKRDLDWFIVQNNDVGFHTFKDQVIFEKDEIVKDDGKPYTVSRGLKRERNFMLSYQLKISRTFHKTQNKPLHTLKIDLNLLLYLSGIEYRKESVNKLWQDPDIPSLPVPAA
jgi:deoxyribodipyrimidine photo-lyase